MTRIEFHFNTSERLLHTCRLLRKARAQNLRIAVVGAGPAGITAATLLAECLVAAKFGLRQQHISLFLLIQMMY